jgi:hypothetical protein
MCNLDENPARSAPVRVILILSICLGGLILHSFAGNPGMPSQSVTTMNWIDEGEKDDPSHMTGEDTFILPEYSDQVNPQSSIRVLSPELHVYCSVAFLPIVPPPDL